MQMQSRYWPRRGGGGGGGGGGGEEREEGGAHLIAPVISQHGKVQYWESCIRLGQVKILGFFDVKAHAHSIMGG